jgi:hypothetical protein
MSSSANTLIVFLRQLADKSNYDSSEITHNPREESISFKIIDEVTPKNRTFAAKH